MNNKKPEPRPLHPEVVLGFMFSGVVLLAGLLVTNLSEDWTPLAIGSIVGAGVLFVSLCIPQIEAAREAKRDAQRGADE